MAKLSIKECMERAIHEQFKCTEYPMVGCIIVKDDNILSTGYKGEIGDKHAERIAIEKLDSNALQGSTIYTTLEPCIKFYDNQQIESCSELIVNSGIKNIYIGCLDTYNGQMYGKGVKYLREQGVTIKYFSDKYKEIIKNNSFELNFINGSITKNGTHIFHIPEAGVQLIFENPQNKADSIIIKWELIQGSESDSCVDLLCYNDNYSLFDIPDTNNIKDIIDPNIYEFPTHCLRLRKNKLALVNPKTSKFYLIIKLIDIYPTSIKINWQINIK